MKYVMHVYYEQTGDLLISEQVDILSSLGFTGMAQRKSYDEYYSPSEDEVRTSLSLGDIQHISKSFTVKVDPYKITLSIDPSKQ